MKNNIAYSFKYIGTCKYLDNLQYDKLYIYQKVKDNFGSNSYEKTTLFDLLEEVLIW